TVAQQNNIQQYGTILFQYKGRSERVTSDAEQDITNGIIKTVSGQQRKVYFTQGHGEKDTGSSERDGYNTIATALGRENYRIEQPFDEASPRSWAEADIEGVLTSGQVSLDENKGDKKGPTTIGSAVSAPLANAPAPKPGDDPNAPKPETRVVVLGDSDFASN